MKFATFVVLSCLCIGLANSAKLSTWGNVTGRFLGTEIVKAEGSVFQVKTRQFTYRAPSGSPIQGIKHLDYKQHPVDVSFINSDIGQNSITIKVTSQRGHGINSAFTFYTN